MRLCQELIWTSHLTNTYCMREHGHEGSHYITNKEPTKEELEALKVEDARQSNK